MCRLTRAASLGSGVDEELTSRRWQRGCLRFGAKVLVSASGVIARNLSNELKDAFSGGCISDKSVLDRVVC